MSDLGEPCFEVEQRILLTTQATTEVVHSIAPIFCPVADEVQNSLKGVQLEERISRTRKETLNDATTFDEESSRSQLPIDLHDAEVETITQRVA